MRAKLLNDAGERLFALIFDIDEDPMQGLQRFAEEQNLSASGFTAIGAFREAELGYFDWDKKDYERIPVREQTEVLALVQRRLTNVEIAAQHQQHVGDIDVHRAGGLAHAALHTQIFNKIQLRFIYTIDQCTHRTH